jgi:hypothetical protein
MLIALEDLAPVVHPSAYVHPSAVLIGDVIVGAGCYVGPTACLRGDFGRLEMRAGANVQDSCILHAYPGVGTVVEEDGHIGHGAILHGCIVKRNALVGMNAVVNDNAVIGESAVFQFVGYFTLSWLLFRAWRDTFPFPGSGWSMQWARISFFMTALVACLDEWHQSYLPSRTGNLHDVLLDSTAALIAQVILFLLLRRHGLRSNPQLTIS